MHPLVDEERLRAFMRALGAEPGCQGRVYFTGGVTAVLLGWRSRTADADLVVVPDTDKVLRALQRLKQDLCMNVELASPAHFLPELPGWEDRSRFIAREGRIDFFHYDLYAQALSKILRGQEKDLADVQAMIARGLVEPQMALTLFTSIEDQLFRRPNINAGAFRKAVLGALGLDPGSA